MRAAVLPSVLPVPQVPQGQLEVPRGLPERQGQRGQPVRQRLVQPERLVQPVPPVQPVPLVQSELPVQLVQPTGLQKQAAVSVARQESQAVLALQVQAAEQRPLPVAQEVLRQAVRRSYSPRRGRHLPPEREEADG